MLDIVLQGFVTNFVDTEDLHYLSTDKQFEAFATHSVLQNYHYLEQPELETVFEKGLTGGSGDGKLDSIAILLDGQPVHTEHDVASKLRNDRGPRPVAHFIFVQAKTADRKAFSTDDINNFITGVEQFIHAASGRPHYFNFNERVGDYISVAKAIYRRPFRIANAKPNCSLYFVTADKWTDAPEPTGALNSAATRLQADDHLFNVDAIPVDSTRLKAISGELLRANQEAIEVYSSAAFPPIQGVKSAYMAMVPGREFMKLATTDNGDLNRNLFYENVRDFQGINDVNSEIGETLLSDQTRHTFPLLNNGVTIIAQSIEASGNTFLLRDYQIVNGCQTTNMLFRNKARLDDKTFVPVKLVETTEEQLKVDVVRGTNRQTLVEDVVIESLKTFHKELEAFYRMAEAKSQVGEWERIHYERRSKQYANEGIPRSNIVTLAAQVQSFFAMFLNEPHSSSARNAYNLFEQEKARIFVSEKGKAHLPAPYYASGLSLLTINRCIKSPSVDAEDRSFLQDYRYHILMLLRASIGGLDVPRLNSRQINDYSLRIVEALRDEVRGPIELEQAVSTIRAALVDFPRHRDSNRPHRLKSFTDKLLQGARDDSPRKRGGAIPVAPQPSTGDADVRGKLRSWSETAGYGYIETLSGDVVLVEAADMTEVKVEARIRGQALIFGLSQASRSYGRSKATRVRVDTAAS